MPKVIDGQYTIKELIQLSYDSKYSNRFTYAKRDKIKTIYIRKIKSFDPKDIKKEPTYSIEAISVSTPQYKPYLTPFVTKKYKKGKKSYERKSQRYFKNQYTIYFRIYNKNGSINSKKWKIKLGEDKKFIKYNPKFIRSKKNPNGKYLSQGHANAILNGINADWIFRCAYWFRVNGHAYNVRYSGYKQPKISDHIFLPKHLINFLNLLMQAKLLADVEPGD